MRHPVKSKVQCHSRISRSHKDSPSSVITDRPTSKLKPERSRSLEGTSSVPKKNSHPKISTEQIPRGCPSNKTPTFSADTIITRQLIASETLFRDATNLSSVFLSRHPRSKAKTSSGLAGIKVLSFLLNCRDREAERQLPFFLQTLLLARKKRSRVLQRPKRGQSARLPLRA